MLWDVVWLRLRDWLAGKPSYTLAPLHDEAAAEQEGQRKLAA
jgi:hypothetical protein